jgi:hypothetical protein
MRSAVLCPVLLENFEARLEVRLVAVIGGRVGSGEGVGTVGGLIGWSVDNMDLTFRLVQVGNARSLQ